MNRAQLMIDIRQFNEMGYLISYVLLRSIDGLKYETEYSVLHYGFKNVHLIYFSLINTKYSIHVEVKTTASKIF